MTTVSLIPDSRRSVVQGRCFDVEWVRGRLQECVAAGWDRSVCDRAVHELAEALAMTVALMPAGVVCDPRGGQDRSSELLGRGWIRVPQYAATFANTPNPWGAIRAMLRREAGVATLCSKRGLREDRHVSKDDAPREVPVSFEVLEEIVGSASTPAAHEEEPVSVLPPRFECVAEFLAARGMPMLRAQALVKCVCEVALEYPASKRHTAAAVEVRAGRLAGLGFVEAQARACMSLVAGSRSMGVESSLVYQRHLAENPAVLPVHEVWAKVAVTGRDHRMSAVQRASSRELLAVAI